MSDDTATVELRDQILKERDAGRIVFWGLPGELMAAPLDDFLKQPVDGILYDLNRLEEVVLTFLKDPKWVNDFAVAQVIRRQVRTIAELREEMRRQREAMDRTQAMQATAIRKHVATIAEQAARLAECERDAGRYRWLASRSAYFSLSVYPGFREGEHHDMWDMNGKHSPSLDAAIDGAKT